MRYRIRLHSEAKRDLRRLPGHVRQRFLRLIETLSTQPRSEGAVELRDLPGHCRIWLDDWRLIYEVDDQSAIVGVLRAWQKTGPETYEDLPQW